MTCEEFREQFQLYLDRKETGPLPADLQGHTDACAGCRNFVARLMVTEEGLRNMRQVPVPPDLLKKLYAIADRQPAPSLGMSPDVYRGAAYVVPVLLVWLLGTLLSSDVRILLNGVIAFGMLMYLFQRFLRPFFFQEAVH